MFYRVVLRKYRGPCNCGCTAVETLTRKVHTHTAKRNHCHDYDNQIDLKHLQLAVNSRDDNDQHNDFAIVSVRERRHHCTESALSVCEVTSGRGT